MDIDHVLLLRVDVDTLHRIKSTRFSTAPLSLTSVEGLVTRLASTSELADVDPGSEILKTKTRLNMPQGLNKAFYHNLSERKLSWTLAGRQRFGEGGLYDQSKERA